jgi:hypothetical protein
MLLRRISGDVLTIRLKTTLNLLVMEKPQKL